MTREMSLEAYDGDFGRVNYQESFDQYCIGFWKLDPPLRDALLSDLGSEWAEILRDNERK